MKKTFKYAYLGTIAAISSITSAEASLIPSATLNFDAPVYNSLGQVISGSNFGVDFTGDGTIELIERTGLEMNNGLQLGTTQLATPTSPNIDNPWNFFGLPGVHFSSSDINVISDDNQGNVELDFSGWGVNWNGIDIGMGGSSWGSNPDGIAQMTCSNDCSTGDSFSIYYTATVTEGPFIGVRYRLGFDSNSLLSAALLTTTTASPTEDPGIIATGTIGPSTISSVPLPTSLWLFGSGLISLISLIKRKNNT